MQSNASLIKKLMMHIDSLGKNLYPVGRAKLSKCGHTNIQVDILNSLECNISSEFDFIYRNEGGFENKQFAL